MPFNNQAAKGALIELLRGSRRAVLLVGSGTSIPVGYPSWPQLLDELRNSVVPELAQFPVDLDLLGRAELVRTALKAHRDRVDRQRQFDQYLSGRFAPRTPSHTQVHRTLVRLPFCGFVTTNYDPAIEAAATYVQVGAGRDIQCEPIDLCSDSPDHSFRFLRGLGNATTPSAVLHVPGFWRRSDQIILSTGDYASRYGISEPVAAEGEALAVPTRPLDTFHRKVVWSLLTMYPVVFVGFSVEDRAFQLMLDFVHEDFKLAPNPPAHFAILGAQTDEDRERDATRLRRFGVMPVSSRTALATPSLMRSSTWRRTGSRLSEQSGQPGPLHGYRALWMPQLEASKLFVIARVVLGMMRRRSVPNASTASCTKSSCGFTSRLTPNLTHRAVEVGRRPNHSGLDSIDRLSHFSSRS